MQAEGLGPLSCAKSKQDRHVLGLEWEQVAQEEAQA